MDGSSFKIMCPDGSSFKLYIGNGYIHLRSPGWVPITAYAIKDKETEVLINQDQLHNDIVLNNRRNIVKEAYERLMKVLYK